MRHASRWQQTIEPVVKATTHEQMDEEGCGDKCTRPQSGLTHRTDARRTPTKLMKGKEREGENEKKIRTKSMQSEKAN
jgi:hypothetical protein